MRVVMKWGGRLLASIVSCSGGSSLDRLITRPCLRGRRGARSSSISPVAIFMTCTAHAVSLCGRRSPFGPMGMPPSLPPVLDCPRQTVRERSTVGPPAQYKTRLYSRGISGSRNYVRGLFGDWPGDQFRSGPREVAMRNPLLIIAAPFVLLAIFMNSPLRDSLGSSTSRSPAVSSQTPEMGAYLERERAARERRIAAAEAGAAHRSQEETEAINARARVPRQRVASSANRVEAAPRPQLGARDWAARVQGGLDSPMQDIQYQLAESGISPSLSRQGNYRVFTYRFRDGSVLEFTAIPAGGQRGLILHSVDIQD